MPPKKLTEKVEEYYERGREHINKAQYNKAIEIYSEGIELYPKQGKLYRLRGWCYHQQSKMDLNQAFVNFSKAIELDSSSFQAYNDRGYVLLDVGQYNRAIKDFTRVIELGGEKYGYVGRARTYKLKGDYALAEQDFKRAVELNPRMKMESMYRKTKCQKTP